MNLQTQLAEHLCSAHPRRAATVLEAFEPEESVGVLSTLDPSLAAPVLSAMLPHYGALLLDALDPRFASQMLVRLAPHVAAGLLRRLPPDRRDGLLSSVEAEPRAWLSPLLAVRSNTAAARASPDVLTLVADARIGEILDTHRDALIRATYDIPVVDDSRRLVGLVSAAELLLSTEDGRVGSIARRDVARVGDRLGLEKIVQHAGWKEASALPVVDAQGVFIGLLLYESLRQIERELHARPIVAQLSTSQALGDLVATALGGVFEAFLSTGRPRLDD